MPRTDLISKTTKMFRKSRTTVELPEFVRESIPDVNVEKKYFGSSITDNTYAYTGFEDFQEKLYWKLAEGSGRGIVFSVGNNGELVIGEAQTPFSPIQNVKKIGTKRREEILTPYLGKYSELLSTLFGKEKLQQERLISDFLLEVIGNLERDDFKFLLHTTGESARKSILDTMKLLFQKKCNEMLN